MNNQPSIFYQAAYYCMDSASKFASLAKPLLLPNSTLISQEKRQYCLVAGLIATTGMIALKIFTAMTWQTFHMLTAASVVPLIGGITGIPLFVYASCALSPTILFFISALAFSFLFPPLPNNF